jgi:hypothetical protein
MASKLAITVKVAAAFLDSFGLKTGTPLEIASVPLMATAPAENDLNTSHNVTGCAICKIGGGVAGTSECVKTLIIPTIIIAAKLKMNT